MTKDKNVRVLARETARELSKDEIEAVAGGEYTEQGIQTWTGCDSSGCSDGDT